MYHGPPLLPSSTPPGAEQNPGAVNADVSEAHKLGVDAARGASSLTKKKEEPTTWRGCTIRGNFGNNPLQFVEKQKINQKGAREKKTRLDSINPPWINPKRETAARVSQPLGLVPDSGNGRINHLHLPRLLASPRRRHSEYKTRPRKGPISSAVLQLWAIPRPSRAKKPGSRWAGGGPEGSLSRGFFSRFRERRLENGG